MRNFIPERFGADGKRPRADFARPQSVLAFFSKTAIVLKTKTLFATFYKDIPIMNAEKIPTIPAARSGGCIFSLVKLAILALAIIAAIAYFALSYTGYVADYALKTITKGTGIDAGVGTVSFSLSEQKCDVKNFYITNPPNYPEGNAVEFKTAYVDADIGLSDILAKKLVKVEEVRIEGLKISYDMKTKKGLASLLSSPDNNLNEIVEILLGAQKKKEQEPASAADSQNEPFRIILDKLVFADGDVKVGLNDKIINIKLPSFTVENLGKNGEGLTPSQLVTEILGRLAKQVTVDVASELAKQGLKMGSDAGKEAGDAAEGATKDLKKSVESALKNLFN